jgi:uncharacterized protein
MVAYRYNSADNHLDPWWTPADVWQRRVPPHLRDRAPRVVVEAGATGADGSNPAGMATSGTAFWEWEGKRGFASNAVPNNARALKQFRDRGVDTPEGTLPPSDPTLLLEHMDRANIYSAVLFGPTRKWKIEDPELLLACYRAYNDFILEFNANDPNRIVGLPILPASVPEACTPELERVARGGAKAVELAVWDAGQPVWHEVWEDLWAAAADADIPICSHIGDTAGTPYPPTHRGQAKAHFSTAPTNIMRPIAQMVFSGAFERHPTLRYMYSECNIGWVPYLLDWMDRQERERPKDPTALLSMPPSEYFKRQIRITFEDDPVGGRLLAEPWSRLADIAMWGADYPHNALTWPNPEPILEKILAGVDAATRRAVLFDRAAEFFKLKVPELAH